MTAGALRRLLAMDRKELRFRGGAAARRLVDRTAAVVAAPRWRRGSLAGRLRKGAPLLDVARACLRRRDWFGAHEALGRHCASKATPFPVAAADLDRIAQAVKSRFPEAEADAGGRAARLLKGCHDLLGYEDVNVGIDPDWHRDPISGRRAPMDFWADVPYLSPACGDHKVTWELNRHQHWLQLGRAYKLTGDRACYERFVGELESWLAANPPLTGTNWASMLEIGFRTVSWLWAIQFFSATASKQDRFPWMVDILCALYRQLAHVAQNLSRYFSPNTHLTGEALALYVAGRALPELKDAEGWAGLGRQVLLDEAGRQIAGDGGHAELSAHYHRYSTDFYLLALLVASRSGDPAAAAFERAARAQAGYLRTICDDNGQRPATGDDDGGQLFPICGTPADDCRPTLSTSAVILGDLSLAVDAYCEETYWLGVDVPPSSPPERRLSGSSILADTGYCVSRTANGDHLLFDAGPHGYLNGGHAHADALSTVLTIGRVPFLIDPGTATYTMDPALRDLFRSTAMHNTLTVDGRSQSRPAGPFQWASMASAQLRVGALAANCDYFEGSHTGYRPSVHARGVLALHGVGWFIVDLLDGEAAMLAQAHWHLHPSWNPMLRTTDGVLMSIDDRRAAVFSTSPLDVLGAGEPLAHVSLAYGRLEPSHTLRASVHGPPPLALLTCVDPAPDGRSIGEARRCEVVIGPGAGWHGLAFRVRTGSGELQLLAAFERGPERANQAGGPGCLWGSADLRTDARLAALLARGDGRAEAVLVHGGRLESGRGDTLLDCGGPIQLIRSRCPGSTDASAPSSTRQRGN